MKSRSKILILDDEEELRAVIAQRLKRRGYEIWEAGSAKEGMDLLRESLFDLVLLDLRLPDGNGLTFLPQIKERQPDLQVVMLTGHGTVESAIEAMKKGAFDYLMKPCDLSELEITLQKALEQRKLMLENTGLRQVVNRQRPELQIIGESEALHSLTNLAQKLAQADAPVLIQGESGTGKELFARALHVWSPRSSQAYIPLNSGAIPETLMESELFGYEKGAFTGAGGTKLGLVEMADHGTLFLDEIGEMPFSLQIKLLRFLETGEFRRVGDNRLRRVDVRIVTATNRDLSREVEEGRFRQDLYYRLNGLTLSLPPLRERREDILPLAQYFLDSNRKKGLGQNALQLSDEGKQTLLQYDFPGNIRELAHLMERAAILAEGPEIYPQDFWPEQISPRTGKKIKEEEPEEPKKPPRQRELPEESNDAGEKIYNGAEEKVLTLAEVERDYILKILKKVNGNRTQAARLLGVSVRNLYRKIEEYGDEASARNGNNGNNDRKY
ncbi:sigma-54 dependent transcriptional regulator [Desulfitobacterium sp.]|uniref:sigma-54-dependent transcriptional regulator n=1 Tax=Desulfitobacterium sp. TaxID=49981 RepID=UPI002B209E04|nr:sigma-54 dependent transcriptional regulator [Desulfitobacterium sp.]MEA4900044.1 sigma-54 dependent transcriptional regulator [Desulfitobacterium sp.]